MYKEIIEQLDTVLKLNEKRKQAVNKALKMNYKKVAGGIFFKTTETDRLIIADCESRWYDKAIGTVYASINSQLSASGKEKLNNPFMKGDL